MHYLLKALTAAALSFVVVFVIAIIALKLSIPAASVVMSLGIASLGAITGLYLTDKTDQGADFIGRLLLNKLVTLVSFAVLTSTWCVGVLHTYKDKNPKQRVWKSYGVAIIPWLFVSAIFLVVVYCVPGVKKHFVKADD